MSARVCACLCVSVRVCASLCVFVRVCACVCEGKKETELETKNTQAHYFSKISRTERIKIRCV